MTVDAFCRSVLLIQPTPPNRFLGWKETALHRSWNLELPRASEVSLSTPYAEGSACGTSSSCPTWLWRDGADRGSLDTPCECVDTLDRIS